MPKSIMLGWFALSVVVQTPQPNIVVIMADDMGFGDLSCTGSLQIKTPHIDNLAKNGMMFTQGYVSAPVCAPSRSGFLTGCYQNLFGCEFNMVDPAKGVNPEFVGLPDSETTIAERLQSLGYRTGLIGKWHQGTEPQFHPIKHGFDEFYGFLSGGHNYITKGKGNLESNVEEVREITYLTDDLGDAGMRFIKRNKENPFFLFMSFNAPHTPMQALEEDLALYNYIPQTKRRTYAAMIHRLDINVGKIVGSLKEKNLLNHTMIVFLSDNGGAGATNYSVNAPYRGQKGCVLEGGIHVPFIIQFPPGFEPGSSSNIPVTSLDLTPTFVELAGGKIKPKEISGTSIFNLLKESDVQRDLFWKFGPTEAYRKGNYKLLKSEDRLPVLYSLDKDQAEQNDLAEDNKDLVMKMLRIHSDWVDTLAKPLYHEQPIWRRNQMDHLDRSYPITQPKKEGRLEWKLIKPTFSLE